MAEYTISCRFCEKPFDGWYKYHACAEGAPFRALEKARLLYRTGMSVKESNLLRLIVEWQLDMRSFSNSLNLDRRIDLLAIPDYAGERQQKGMLREKGWRMPAGYRDSRDLDIVARLLAYGLQLEEAEKWLISSRCGGWAKKEWKGIFEAGWSIDKINGARYLRPALEQVTRMGVAKSSVEDWSVDSDVGYTFGGGKG